MIRLMCVEDDPSVRAYLEIRLTCESDFEVVSSVEDVCGALTQLRSAQIDVVLLDYSLAGVNGAFLLDAIANWGEWNPASNSPPAVLFCTGCAEPAFESMAEAKGARGVLQKSQMSKELASAVRTVAAGGSWFPSKVGADGWESRVGDGGWWPNLKSRLRLS